MKALNNELSRAQCDLRAPFIAVRFKDKQFPESGYLGALEDALDTEWCASFLQRGDEVESNAMYQLWLLKLSAFSFNKKLLGAPGIATRGKDARGSWPYY